MGGYYDVDKQSENAPRSSAAPEPGLGAVSEYQVSALPYATSSQANTGVTYNISFPKVTSWIVIKNHGTATEHIRLGFTKNGVEGGNHIRIDGGTGAASNPTYYLRVKEVFIRSDSGASPGFSLLAGLTMIPTKFMPTLTGSVSSSQGYWDGVG